MVSSTCGVALVFIVVAFVTAELKVSNNATLQIPITQTVGIDGIDVYSQSAGHATLNQCQQFAPSAVKSEDQPVIKVCGTQTKVTVFLRNRCESYSSYQETIGACDTKMDTATCVTAGPSTVQWMLTAQSYMIEQCATGTQR